MKDNENNQTETEQKIPKKSLSIGSVDFKFCLNVLILIFATIVTVASYIHFGGDFFSWVFSESKLNELKSNIAFADTGRNIWLLAFAIFGGGLAIWGRSVAQRQLQYSHKQLEDSAEINRNDRFAKAVELINNKDSRISTRGGLRMLRDLVDENPEVEYIRCAEIISHWLMEDAKELQGYGNQTIKGNLLDIAVGIFRTKIDAELQVKIKSHKNKNEWTYWPILEGASLNFADLKCAYLQGANFGSVDILGVGGTMGTTQETNLFSANLENANLQDAKLKDASLRGANLKNTILQNANLTNADMSDAKGLTKEQILSAKWFIGRYNEPPPKLPDYLMEDPDVQEWLSKPKF